MQKIVERFSLQKGVDIYAKKILDDIYQGPESLEINNKGLTTAFDDGYTIELYQPQRYCDELWKILERLESYFGCLVSSTAYITPNNSQTFTPRYELTEVGCLN